MIVGVGVPPIGVAVISGVGPGVSLGVTVGVNVGVFVGVTVDVTDAVGVTELVTVGLIV